MAAPPLGTDDVEIASLLAAANVAAADLDAAEFDISGDAQKLDAVALTTLMNASVILAKAPSDTDGNTIIREPPATVTPTTCAQLVVADGSEAIRLAALANTLAAGGNELATMQWLIDAVRLQRGY